MSTLKKFFLKTFGCQMNVYDGGRIAGMLAARGMTATDDAAAADVIILNTCSVREKASNKVFSELGRLRDRKRDGALMGIVGCVAREEGAHAFARIPELNFVLGPQQYHRLPAVLDNPDARHLFVDLSGLEKFDAMAPTAAAGGAMAYVPIQEGCGHHCTYCIVPFTRGPELSRPFDDCVKEAAASGATEICFLGQNVNGYKYDLAALIREVAKLPNVKRIRYTSSYPLEMTDDLIALHGTEQKLLPFVNLPIQSGSPEILRRMNRPYDLEKYTDIIRRLRAARADIQISSDFIVGFPGETDADFDMSCRVARDIGYINSYSFKYSKRPHTAAATMPDQVPEQVKRERLKILDDILTENNRAFNLSCVGREMECLFDGKNYRTPFMQQVVVAGQGGPNAGGGPIEKIKITDGNKCSLRGRICQ
ncbi:MAG: tRNA (N6-isopentenyl adenosine(37)-C2)-methylthiotransferase MiaB [Rickettsiales bacterium]|jgi:tRNA-2-methylthio-N6-dimethylallyladenosine synthase|nr:tRNA (N6-isopentenyl adenosine(37)-C2)-methylthiotransferase MiaB [Rickettsiales bacterium]